MTGTHTALPVAVTANGNLGFGENNQMDSLFGVFQEGFSEEAAYEPRVRGWGHTFGAKDTQGRGAVDSTHPFSQEG